MPGEFELYGHRFRWIEPERVEQQSDPGLISLARVRRPFPESIEWLSAPEGKVPAFGKLGPCSVYRFEGVGDFLFPPNGRYVKMFVHPDTEYSTLEFVLYRGVVPRILHLRGTTSLHASAVASDGGVAAFCGPSGAGKSTLAAALSSRGMPLVTDDVLPLREDPAQDQVLAGPGLPELRVYPATADLLGLNGQVMAPAPGQTKARWQPHRAPNAPLPLRSIYLLEPNLRGSSSGPASLTPLPRQQALLDLISNSYWVNARETRALATDMMCLGRLLRSVPVFRLSFELSDSGFAAVENLLSMAVGAAAR